jgi:hypothetical protein
MVRSASTFAILAVVGCTSSNPAYEGEGEGEGGGSSSTGLLGEASGSSTGSAGSVGSVGATGSSTGVDPSASTSRDADGPSDDPSAEGSTTEPPMVCDRALWVTGDVAVESNGDAPFFLRLEALGFVITVVQNAASQPEDVGDNCLVVLSPLGAALDVEDKFREAPVPVITWEYNLYDNMRMVDPLGTGWGIADPLDHIQIIDPAHPLAAGLGPGQVPLYVGAGRVSWGMPVGEAQIIATLPGDPTRATHFAFEAGAMMAGEFVAPARRVALGGGETLAMPTPQAVELFAAAVEWAVQ